jgi:cyclohexanecarboxylate-CoA ligase/acyl-CoA synthetase
VPRDQDVRGSVKGEENSGLNDEGWFHTGDAGWLDAGGRLFVVGRTDDLIIKGGNKIDPRSVEVALETCSGVERAGVVAVAGRVGVSRTVAAVVLAEDKTMDQVCEFVRNSLTDGAVPDLLVWVSAIPEADDGQIKRAELRERLSAYGDSARISGSFPPSGEFYADGEWLIGSKVVGRFKS